MKAADKAKLTKLLEVAEMSQNTLTMGDVAAAGIKIDEEASSLIVDHQQRSRKKEKDDSE